MCARAHAIAGAHSNGDPSRRVVVTGMGLTTCLGHEVDTFYNNLLEVGAGPLGVHVCQVVLELGHWPTCFIAVGKQACAALALLGLRVSTPLQSDWLEAGLVNFTCWW